MEDIVGDTVSKTCSKCGETKPVEEFVKKGNYCKVCKAKLSKAWRKANKEKIKAYNKAWREVNKEKIKAYYLSNTDYYKNYSKNYYEHNKERYKDYREANKEEILVRDRATSKAYYKANKDKVDARHKRRRDMKKEAYVHRCSYWEQVATEMEEKKKVLQEETGLPHEIDHIYPLSKGGIDHPVNFQILTAKENRSKYNKVDESCPLQAKLKYISDLVLIEGVHIDEAIRLGEKNYEK